MSKRWPGGYYYDPCDRCGYATRFKQFPLICACTSADRCPHPPGYVRADNVCRRCGGDSRMPRENMNVALRELVQEIQAEQVRNNALLPIPSGPPLRIADRYTEGRPRR